MAYVYWDLSHSRLSTGVCPQSLFHTQAGPGVQTCVGMTSTTPGLQYDSHQGPIQLYRPGQWDGDREYSIYLPKAGYLGTCWGELPRRLSTGDFNYCHCTLDPKAWLPFVP